MPALADLHIDDTYPRDLPADPLTSNTPRQVRGAGHSHVAPTPVADPKILAVSSEMLEVLGLDPSVATTPDFASLLGGNSLLPGMNPWADCYGGHQFGHWAGQLGDGRAITLAEVVTPNHGRQQLQLKGAGRTPYSRRGDGRAVLRSSIREFLCSEAMHHLGVPTTRALSLVHTGDEVLRDMFYDGHAGYEPGAIVCRVAPSFLRFGHFEIHAIRRDVDTLRTLTEHVLARHAPELGPLSPDSIVAMFEEVSDRTALLIAHWQRVGFVHGVLNTDNMSIAGLTIDYGPYGWLEPFDPGWTPNTTDAEGRRYAFGNQPGIGWWNLSRLASALAPMLDDHTALQAALDRYPELYARHHHRLQADKLGLAQLTGTPPSEAEAATGDYALLGRLAELMGRTETDFTLLHWHLADVPTDGEALDALDDRALVDLLAPAFYLPTDLKDDLVKDWAEWLRALSRRSAVEDPVERAARMAKANPRYVLRNYMAQLAIDASTKGDHSVLAELLEVVRNPYEANPAYDKWAARRPDWARHKAGCSMLSCSS